MPLTHPLFNSSSYITLTLLFIFTLSLFIYVFHRGRFNILSSIFSPAANREFNTPVSNLHFTTLILSLFALMGYASMILSLIPAPENWTNLTLSMVATALFIGVKYLVVYIFTNTMFSGVERNFLSRYHQFTLIFGLICYAGRMILSFSIDSTPHNALIVSIIIGVLYCICATYMFFTTFMADFRLIFRLFLYLCTLEIIPVVAFVKALSLV